jgi:hypothetical protein
MDDLLAYFSLGKNAIDIVKGLLEFLPKGEKVDQATIEKAKIEIEKADVALDTSKAELAKKLGFQLCRCKFPPPIMLWDNNQRVNVCPECGNTYPPNPKLQPLRSSFR